MGFGQNDDAVCLVEWTECIIKDARTAQSVLQDEAEEDKDKGSSKRKRKVKSTTAGKRVLLRVR